MAELHDGGGPAGPVASGAPQWEEDAHDQAPQARPGCCTGCPIRAGCGVRDDGASRCAVTGQFPPPPPPAAPAPTGLDVSAATGRGVEAAVSGLSGFGWADVAGQVIERTHRVDAGGNPVEWGRLQIKRNLLCIGLVTLVPLDGDSAARHVANALATGGIPYLLFAPVGMVLCCVGAAWLGTHAPGLLGGVCELGWSVLTFLGKCLWKVSRSGIGWILTRPLIWAAACGILIVIWRAIVHHLTRAA